MASSCSNCYRPRRKKERSIKRVRQQEVVDRDLGPTELKSHYIAIIIISFELTKTTNDYSSDETG
jgi:hypothetical protein